MFEYVHILTLVLISVRLCVMCVFARVRVCARVCVNVCSCVLVSVIYVHKYTARLKQDQVRYML